MSGDVGPQGTAGGSDGTHAGTGKPEVRGSKSIPGDWGWELPVQECVPTPRDARGVEGQTWRAPQENGRIPDQEQGKVRGLLPGRGRIRSICEGVGRGWMLGRCIGPTGHGRGPTVPLRRRGEDGNAGGGRAIGPEADAGLDPAKRVPLRPSGGIRGLRRAAATERPEVGVSVARPAVASSRRRAGSAADSLPTGPAARVPPSGVPETQGRLRGVGGAPKTRGRARIQWQPADAWTVGEARPPGMSGVLWDHRAGPADASGVQ